MEQSARVKSVCNAAQFSLLQNLHRSASFEELCRKLWIGTVESDAAWYNLTAARCNAIFLCRLATWIERAGCKVGKRAICLFFFSLENGPNSSYLTYIDTFSSHISEITVYQTSKQIYNYIFQQDQRRYIVRQK